MKKLFIAALIALMAFSMAALPAMATPAQITEAGGRIELRLNNSGQLLMPINKSDSDAYINSELSCLELIVTKDNVKRNDLPWIEYTVSASTSGYYSLHWTGVAYNLGSRSSAFWRMTVNPGEGEKSYDVNNTNSFLTNEVTQYVSRNDYTADYIYLNEGTNILRITNLDSAGDSFNCRRLYIQRIDLVRKLDNLTANTQNQYIAVNGTTSVGLNQGGIAISNKYDSIKSISYSSGDSNIATVDNNGNVTGVRPGRCKIDVDITDITGGTIKTSADATVHAKNGLVVEKVWLESQKIYVKYTSALPGATATLIIAGYDEAEDKETSMKVKTALRRAEILNVTPTSGTLTTSNGIDWNTATDGSVVEIFAIDTLFDFHQIYPALELE